MKEGDKLYVPDKKYVADSVTGGIATIDRFTQGGTHVIMKETEEIQWHLDSLIRHQTEYTKQYTGQEARYYSEPFERDNHLW
jgi:hypothetical protein